VARTRKSLAATSLQCRIAYYGLNGTGKTTDASYMAELGEVAVIAAEPGFRKDRLAELGIPIDRLQLAIANFEPDLPDVTFANLDRLFWDLRQEYLDRAKTAPVGFILDTSTEVQKAITEQVRVQELPRAKAKDEGYDFSDYFVQVEWHGIVVNQIQQLLRQYRDLPCHWAICCQEEHREPFRGRGTRSIGPANSPGVQADVMAYSDFVIRLKTLENEDDPKNPFRIGRTEAHTEDGIPARAKDRDHVLPDPFAEPTFARVFAYQRGELTAEKDPMQQELMELLTEGKLLDPAVPKPREKRSERLARERAEAEAAKAS